MGAMGWDIELFFHVFGSTVINDLDFGADLGVGEELSGALLQERFFWFGLFRHYLFDY